MVVERGSFTCAGLGNPQQVLVCQYFRNCLLLNVAWLVEAQFCDRVAIGLVQQGPQTRCPS